MTHTGEPAARDAGRLAARARELVALADAGLLAGRLADLLAGAAGADWATQLFEASNALSRRLWQLANGRGVADHEALAAIAQTLADQIIARRYDLGRDAVAAVRTARQLEADLAALVLAQPLAVRMARRLVAELVERSPVA